MQTEPAGHIRGYGAHRPPCSCRRKYASYKELAQRQERRAKVAAVAARLSYDKEVMGKGRKRKLKAKERGLSEEEASRAGPAFVWKRERKK